MRHKGDLEDLGEAFGEVRGHKLFPEREEMGENHPDLGKVGGETAPDGGKRSKNGTNPPKIGERRGERGKGKKSTLNEEE